MKMLKNRDHKEIYLVPVEDVKEFLVKCPEMRARIINYPTLDRYEKSQKLNEKRERVEPCNTQEEWEKFWRNL